MNIVTETSIVYVLRITQEEAQEVLLDPDLILGAIKRALIVRPKPANNGGHAKKIETEEGRDRIVCLHVRRVVHQGRLSDPARPLRQKPGARRKEHVRIRSRACSRCGLIGGGNLCALCRRELETGKPEIYGLSLEKDHE